MQHMPYYPPRLRLSLGAPVTAKSWGASLLGGPVCQPEGPTEDCLFCTPPLEERIPALS